MTNLLVLVLFERGSALGYVTLPVLAVFAVLSFVFGVRGVRSVAVMESSSIQDRNGNKLKTISTAVAVIGWVMMLFSAFVSAQSMGML